MEKSTTESSWVSSRCRLNIIFHIQIDFSDAKLGDFFGQKNFSSEYRDKRNEFVYFTGYSREKWDLPQLYEHRIA